MHLAETSLIKKYENDIGTSIVDVGGDINHDTHWLPYLDNQIDRQLISRDAPTEKIEEIVEEVLDNYGITPEAVEAWNQGLVDIGVLEERVTAIEQSPYADITAEEINAWNQTAADIRGAVRFDINQNLTESQQRRARTNIGLEKDDMYESQWWDNDLD